MASESINESKVSTPFLNYRCMLGEGPVYDWRNHTLNWVDIRAGAIHVLELPEDEEELISPLKNNQFPHSKFNLGEPIGVLGLTSKPGVFVGALKSSFALIDTTQAVEEDGSNSSEKSTSHVVIARPKITQLCHVYESSPELQAKMRFNDGGIDPKGRFMAGTMSTFGEQVGPDGSVFALKPSSQTNSDGQNFEVEELAQKLYIPNGFGWSPSGHTLFFTDSKKGEIYSVPDYNLKSSTFDNSKKRIFAKVSKGEPDGFTIASNGDLITAVWGNSQILHFNSSGKLIQEIHVPAEKVTCVTFGGKDMNILFVTTAHPQHLDWPNITNLNPSNDLGGSLFAFKLSSGLKGLKSNIWEYKV